MSGGIVIVLAFGAGVAAAISSNLAWGLSLSIAIVCADQICIAIRERR